MTSRRLVLPLTLASFVFVLTGCYKEKSIDGLAPLWGNVQFNGEAVEGASILFLPKNQDGNGKGAVATTDSHGNFRAMTVLPGDGVLPDTYTVVVEKIKYEAETPPAKSANADGKTVVSTPRTYIMMLPEKYADTKTTDLEITVPPKGNKNWNIQLSGDVDLAPKRSRPGSGPGR